MLTRFILIAIFCLSSSFVICFKKNNKLFNKFSKPSLNYISSLEKQNVITYANVKNITPIKKKKRHFILLKSKDDNDLTINIYGLSKKKENKKVGADLHLLNQKQTENLYVTKDERIKNNLNENKINKNDKKETTLLYYHSTFPSPSDGNNDDDDIEEEKRKEIKGENKEEENDETNDEGYNKKNKKEIMTTFNMGKENSSEDSYKINCANKTDVGNIGLNDCNKKPCGGGDDNGDEYPDINVGKKKGNKRRNDEKKIYENKDSNINEKKEDDERNKENKNESNKKNVEMTDEEKKKIMLEEYNNLEQLIKESKEKNLRKIKENEKKDIYELNERIINSSQKWSIENLKKEMDRNFKPNVALERKIQDYMFMFTQDVKKENIPEEISNEYTYTATATDSNLQNDGVSDTEFITEEEEEENKKILKKMNQGDFSDVGKFHFKLSKKDFEKMKEVQENGNIDKSFKKEDEINKKETQKEDEEAQLIDELFIKMQKDEPNVLGNLRQKEKQLLNLYIQKRKEGKIERNEDLENLIYYNTVHRQHVENKDKQNELNDNDTTKSIYNNMDTIFDDINNNKDILENNKIFKNEEKFIFIEKEKILKMSEAQIRDELRKRNYPTFGSLDMIRQRLLQVMKIKENLKIDIKNIDKNPDDNAVSYLKLDKLKKNIQKYKENSTYGDIDSKIKQVDAAIEISKFLNDPTHYLRIDASDKLAKGNDDDNDDIYENDENKKYEDISKEPIINDYNFDKEIAIAERLKKTFNLDNEERLPVGIKKINDAENENSKELDEEQEELNRKEILKYGSLQETVLEFHEKHDLSLDFIGDFICKFTNVDIEHINKYKLLSKEEMENHSNIDIENFLMSSLNSLSLSSIYSKNSTSLNMNYTNQNVIVSKFVDVNELISNYLSSKNIMTLIEYSNIADPVDINHYYSPENLFMLSEEYGLPIQDIVDACTYLNIKLPFGGETHLNKECFNALTTYISKHKKVRKKN